MSIHVPLALTLAIVVSCGRGKELTPTADTVVKSDTASAGVRPSAADSARSATTAMPNAAPVSPFDSSNARQSSVSRPRPTARAQRDSVRGTISLAGPAPTPIVSLILKDGSSLRLVSPQPMATVRQLDGLEIVVYGKPRRRPDEPVEMEEFSVRAVGNDPAQDGILRRTPSGDVLELKDGRRLTIRHLPDYMSNADGKRIWIAGPLDAPTSAGVIDPNRQYHFPE